MPDIKISLNNLTANLTFKYYVISKIIIRKLKTIKDMSNSDSSLNKA